MELLVEAANVLMHRRKAGVKCPGALLPGGVVKQGKTPGAPPGHHTKEAVEEEAAAEEPMPYGPRGKGVPG